MSLVISILILIQKLRFKLHIDYHHCGRLCSIVYICRILKMTLIAVFKDRYQLNKMDFQPHNHLYQPIKKWTGLHPEQSMTIYPVGDIVGFVILGKHILFSLVSPGPEGRRLPTQSAWKSDNVTNLLLSCNEWSKMSIWSKAKMK